jgi:hypothetical protein
VGLWKGLISYRQSIGALAVHEIDDVPERMRNWTYFFAFLDRFKRVTSEEEWKRVLTELGLCMRSSPTYPELVFVKDNIYRFVIDNFVASETETIVVVEFEMSTNGLIEPVMAGCNMDLSS